MIRCSNRHNTTALNWQDPKPYRFIHAILQVGLGAEDFVGSRGAQWPGDLRQEQEVVEEEAKELLVALSLIELPAVQELTRAQTVGHGVEHQLLKHTELNTGIKF